MSEVYGQRPHFDNTNVSFDPIGQPYGTPSLPSAPNPGFAIQYGSNLGNTRVRRCLRRYVYQYDITSNNFNYYSTHKGVRNFGELSSVVDLEELNIRSAEHAIQITGASAPTFITNSLLHSLFSFPSNNGLFFVEGSHHIYVESQNRMVGLSNKPDLFKIYRYGKIKDGKIVVCKNNPNIERKS